MSRFHNVLAVCALLDLIIYACSWVHFMYVFSFRQSIYEEPKIAEFIICQTVASNCLLPFLYRLFRCEDVEDHWYYMQLGTVMYMVCYSMEWVIIGICLVFEPMFLNEWSIFTWCLMFQVFHPCTLTGLNYILYELKRK